MACYRKSILALAFACSATIAGLGSGTAGATGPIAPVVTAMTQTPLRCAPPAPDSAPAFLLHFLKPESNRRFSRRSSRRTNYADTAGLPKYKIARSCKASLTEATPANDVGTGDDRSAASRRSAGFSLFSYTSLAFALALALALTFGFYRLRHPRHCEAVDRNRWQAIPQPPLGALGKSDSALLADLSHEAQVSFVHITSRMQAISGGWHVQSPSEIALQDKYIFNNVRRLQWLFDQAIDLGLIGCQGLQPDLKVHDLSRLFDSVFRVMSPYAGQWRVNLVSNGLASELPWAFDADLIEKVLANLVSNAIRLAAPDGTVTLAVECRNEFVAITISERAANSVQREPAELFNPVASAPAGPIDDQRGAGLGIALSKKIVELHGGELNVRIDSNGCEFCHLELPRQHRNGDRVIEHPFGGMSTLEAEAILSSVDHSREPVKSRPRVLIVDDRTDFGSSLRGALEKRFDVEIACASSLTAAHVRRTLPDLVIADLASWPEHGLPLLAAVRADPVAACIPILVIAPAAAGCQRPKALEAGADEYLAKPVDAATVLSRVAALIEERRRLGSPPRDLAISEGPSETRKRSFLELVRRAISEHLHDEEFSVEQLAGMLHTSRYQLFRRVKQLTGCSPQELVTNARLDRAAALLSRRAGSVSEIAHTVGYGNLPHFSRSFRRKFGMPPSEFAASRNLGAGAAIGEKA